MNRSQPTRLISRVMRRRSLACGSLMTTVPTYVEYDPIHRTSPSRSSGASSWQMSRVRIGRESLPADAAIVGLQKRSADRQPDEIHDDLIGPAAVDRLGEFRRLGPDDDDLGLVDDLLDRVAEQRGEVRDLLLDVLLVRADEPRERDVLVVDAEAAPLAEQRFREDDDRDSREGRRCRL